MSMWPIAAFLVMCLLVGAFDLVARRVPNGLVLASFGISLIALIVSFSGSTPLVLAPEWGSALAGFALALIVFFPLWRFGAMGAGDVKFLAVLGFALGPLGLFWSWLLASVMAGIHAVAVIVIGNLNGSPLGEWVRLRTHRVSAAIWRRLAPLWAWILARRNGRRGTPYATYLAAGALIWIFYLYRQ